MKVFAYVCESGYGGLHGMYEQAVFDADFPNDLSDYVFEAGESLYNSYECFEEDYENLEDFCRHMEIDIWRINSDYTSKSNRELEDIACRIGYMDFIELYCDNQVEY